MLLALRFSLARDNQWLLQGDEIQLREVPEAERHKILIFATATRGCVHLEYGLESFAV